MAKKMVNKREARKSVVRRKKKKKITIVMNDGDALEIPLEVYEKEKTFTLRSSN